MKKTLLAALLVLGLAVLGAPALADAPAECPAPILDQAAAQSVVLDEDERESTLEEILAQSPADPQTKAIDSGICCSTSSQCPSASGYAKWCSNGSCTSNKTCLYRRL
jgi:hypothetical protein